MNLLEQLDVEIEVPAPGFFHLDRSHLDGPDVLASPGASTTWRPLLAHARALHVRRGGERSGVAATTDVGTLTATFLDAADPSTDPDIKPNAPIRLVHRPSGEPVFTGAVVDTYVEHTKGQDSRTIVTINATDAVQALANTERFGAANPVQEWEPWERRVERLLVSAPVRWQPPTQPAALPPVLAFDFEQLFSGGDNPGPYWAEIAEWWPAQETTTSTRIDGKRYVAFPSTGAAPGVWALKAERVVTGLVPGNLYRLSVDFLGTAGRWGIDDLGYVEHYVATWDDPSEIAPVLLVFEFVATSHTHTIRSWGRGGDGGIDASWEFAGLVLEPMSQAATANVVYESTLVNHLDLACNTAGARWFVDRANVVRFTNPALDPRRRHVVRFSDVTENTWPAPVMVLDPPGPDLAWTLHADASTVTLAPAFSPAPADHVFAHAQDFTGTPDRYELTATRTVPGLLPGTPATITLALTVPSALTASHVQIGVDGIGEGREWFVWPYEVGDVMTVQHTFTPTDAEHDVRLRFLGDFPVIGVTFRVTVEQDQPAPDPSIPYTQAEASYDTRAVVNELVLANHARQPDPDRPGQHHADDRNLGPFRDAVSAATWGKRRAVLDTSIPDGVPGVYADAAERLAARILATRRAPEVLVTRITFLGHDHPETAATLEITDPVVVTHRGVDHHALVVGLEHEITPRGWFVHVDLIEQEAP